MKKLLFLHLIALGLLISLFILPSGNAFWKSIDYTSFYALNNSLLNHPCLEIFFSLANIKISDIYGALFFLSSFLLYVYEAKTTEERKIRFGYLLYTLFWFEVTILFTKELLTPVCEYLKVSRHSPTVVLADTIRLSSFTPWAKIKDVSHFCFPSDHAIIVLQWCCFFTYFAGWKRGLFASLFSIIFILPRLIAGAHWLSDILVGSTAIVLIAFAWGTEPKLYNRIMGFIQRRCLRIK